MKNAFLTIAVSVLFLCFAAALGDDNSDTGGNSIVIGSPWSSARKILQRHGIRECDEYPALGFDPGKKPDFTETQFVIDEAIRLWVTRDRSQFVKNIQLHVYPERPSGKPSYQTLDCRAIEFFDDNTYQVLLLRRPRVEPHQGK